MGSGSNNAQKEAQRESKAEQARIEAGSRQVNALMDSPQRQAQYDDYLGARRSEYSNELNRLQEDTTRNLRFALARSGQYGGSVQTDTAVEQARKYNEGVLTAERSAQSDLAGLKTSDEQTRSNLIALLQGGGTQQEATSQALRGLQSNLASSTNQQRSDVFGNTFGNFAKIAENSKAQGEYRRGLKQGLNLYGDGSTGGSW